jgi:hypothetical protein
LQKQFSEDELLLDKLMSQQKQRDSMIIDRKLVETLLEQNESVTLDFKRDQYPFQGANDHEKSELLKDILAFSNAERKSDAFILIGVDENANKKPILVGVSQHLEESNIQEFVNKKTNRPINFSYSTINTKDKQIDVICISIQQRPYFILKDFGKLKANTVYIRRGSSTDMANPDEIAMMNPLTNLNLIEKRIQIYQEAYTMSVKLKQAVSEKPTEKMNICYEVRNWFNENNLYLNPDIRYDFDSTIRDVEMHNVRVSAYYSNSSIEKYNDLITHFDSIMSLPSGIQQSLDSMMMKKAVEKRFEADRK